MDPRSRKALGIQTLPFMIWSCDLTCRELAQHHYHTVPHSVTTEWSDVHLTRIALVATFHYEYTLILGCIIAEEWCSIS